MHEQVLHAQHFYYQSTCVTHVQTILSDLYIFFSAWIIILHVLHLGLVDLVNMGTAYRKQRAVSEAV